MLRATLDKALAATTPLERNTHLEFISELFERRQWPPDEANAVLARLVQMAAMETDRTTLEIILYDLLTASRATDFEVDFGPLLPRLDDIEPALLGYALDLLSFTHDARYRPVLERFLEHADGSIREAARIALEELSGRGG